MADYGLEIYGEDGTRWMDMTDRLARVLGYKTLSSSGSLTNSAFTEGTPFYTLISTQSDPSNDGGYTISFSGSKMSWTKESGYSSIVVIYGVY